MTARVFTCGCSDDDDGAMCERHAPRCYACGASGAVCCDGCAGELVCADDEQACHARECVGRDAYDAAAE